MQKFCRWKIKYLSRQPVRVTVFSPFDDIEMNGVVTSINTARREVKLSRGEDDFDWIKLEDVISAQI
ncbi:YolD-like family protein [Paenibacillus sp. NRS-1780]|uniref:YolD-like family protein n=1 Tax=Paenibacillus sp. NRS-1780 TaxID=3233904 RepID=UPI003D2839D9